MVTITIDANVINAKGKIKAMNQVEQLARAGRICIVKTDTLDTELSQGYRPGLEKSSAYPEDTGVSVLDHSRLGHAVLGGATDDEHFGEILFVLFGLKDRQAYTKNEIRDAMYLKTHIDRQRDFFITNDGAFLDKRDELQNRFSAVVCTPTECLQLLRQQGIASEE